MARTCSSPAPPEKRETGKILVKSVLHVKDSRQSAHLKAGESDADDKVGHPIDEHRDGHSTGTRPLGEELGSDHPRNGARSHGEEDDKGQHRHHGQVAHPVDHFLNITKKFLHYVGSNMFSMLKGFCLLRAWFQKNTRFLRLHFQSFIYRYKGWTFLCIFSC